MRGLFLALVIYGDVPRFSAAFIVPQRIAQGDGVMGQGTVLQRVREEILELDAADEGTG